MAPEVTRLGRAGSTSRAQRDAPTAQQEGAMVGRCDTRGQ